MNCTSANKTIKELLEDAAAKECDEKLDRLMKDYGIEAGDYKSLARKLAIDHIPGFRAALKLEHDTWGAVTQDKKKGGRPTERKTEWLDELIIAVTDAKKLPEISTDDEALRHIAKSGKWRRPADRDLGAWVKTLKNLLARTRRIERGVSRLQEKLEEIKRNNPGN